jgi:hypothetical protein
VQTDRSLSNLVDALRKAGLWEDTLLVVTSDVAAATDISTTLPFGEPLELTEEALHVPLYIHFPGHAHAGERFQAPTTAMDVAQTALAALGIDMPDALGGLDLFTLADQHITPVERALQATLPDRFASRWADLRMTARNGAPPFLCDLGVDPACEHDLREQRPLLTSALWRFSFDTEALARDPAHPRPRREPATLDNDTADAMAVWGR